MRFPQKLKYVTKQYKLDFFPKMNKRMCMVCKNRENQAISCCASVVKHTLIFIYSPLTEFCSV